MDDQQARMIVNELGRLNDNLESIDRKLDKLNHNTDELDLEMSKIASAIQNSNL